jgi:hypothetical protein
MIDKYLTINAKICRGDEISAALRKYTYYVSMKFKNHDAASDLAKALVKNSHMD